MYYHDHPIIPGQPAVTGALSIFVEGCRRENVRQQLVGLSVLQSAQPGQLAAAMSSVAASQQISREEIEALFLR